MVLTQHQLQLQQRRRRRRRTDVPTKRLEGTKPLYPPRAAGEHPGIVSGGQDRSGLLRSGRRRRCGTNTKQQQQQQRGRQEHGIPTDSRRGSKSVSGNPQAQRNEPLLVETLAGGADEVVPAFVVPTKQRGRGYQRCGVLRVAGQGPGGLLPKLLGGTPGGPAAELPVVLAPGLLLVPRALEGPAGDAVAGGSGGGTESQWEKKGTNALRRQQQPTRRALSRIAAVASLPVVEHERPGIPRDRRGGRGEFPRPEPGAIEGALRRGSLRAAVAAPTATAAVVASVGVEV
mmetsp:Transcript_115996/g.237172  ORF Transcript_115996/g.237172 Transcript_115996/m.237172 type:complete len:288 (+) Transcript_115996:47-910(+)